MAMSIPVWVLLAFAVWSMLVLILTVGIYRCGLIFAGRVQANEFRQIRSKVQIGTAARCAPT